MKRYYVKGGDPEGGMLPAVLIPRSSVPLVENDQRSGRRGRRWGTRGAEVNGRT